MVVYSCLVLPSKLSTSDAWAPRLSSKYLASATRVFPMGVRFLLTSNTMQQSTIQNTSTAPTALCSVFVASTISDLILLLRPLCLKLRVTRLFLLQMRQWHLLQSRLPANRMAVSQQAVRSTTACSTSQVVYQLACVLLPCHLTLVSRIRWPWPWIHSWVIWVARTRCLPLHYLHWVLDLISTYIHMKANCRLAQNYGGRKRKGQHREKISIGRG